MISGGQCCSESALGVGKITFVLGDPAQPVQAAGDRLRAVTPGGGEAPGPHRTTPLPIADPLPDRRFHRAIQVGPRATEARASFQRLMVRRPAGRTIADGSALQPQQFPGSVWARSSGYSDLVRTARTNAAAVAPHTNPTAAQPTVAVCQRCPGSRMSPPRPPMPPAVRSPTTPSPVTTDGPGPLPAVPATMRAAPPRPVQRQLPAGPGPAAAQRNQRIGQRPRSSESRRSPR